MKYFNPALEAEDVLAEHTEAYLNAAITHEKINSLSTGDLFKVVDTECAYILTKRWIEGKYTIREYFSVRSELAKLLNKLRERDI